MSSKNSSVFLNLLGRFEVAREGRKLRAEEWPRRKAAALLKYLAIHKRLVKDQAIDLLWPDSDPGMGANNLYKTLHELRQTLNQPLGPGTAELVFGFEGGVLSLQESVRVDVFEFERLCSASPQSQEQQISSLEQALALYQGDLLPDDLYEEWTIPARQALRRQYGEASLKLAALYRHTHQYERIFPLLTPLLAHDPADEPVHRELMRAYSLAGRRHDALRQYQACVEALAAELDLAPEPETAALYTQILNGRAAAEPGSTTRPREPGRFAGAALQPSPLMAGRQAEFETLLKLQSCVQKGTGRTILISGDPGVGKTLLAGELMCASAGAGMQTLFGSLHEQEGQLPYQPFIEAFDHYLSQQGQGAQENPITQFKGFGSGDPEQNQLGLFNAAAAFLTGLASQAPVMLLVDDLHAADEASLHLFHYLARKTAGSPVVLLATYRADSASPVTTAFGSLLNALYREQLSETLELLPLPEKSAAQIVSQVLGGEATPALVQVVHDVTEGNPFFIQEITRALLRSGQLEEGQAAWDLRPDTQLRVPADLKDWLKERVARLGPQVNSVLASAAVVGREFDFETLRFMTALAPAGLLDALDTALSSHVLEETETGYRFHHGLIRQALYDSLSRARRASLHGRAGEAIEALCSRRAQDLTAQVEDLAHHFDLSDRRDRALEYLIRAGQKAANLYAFESAVRHFEQALALMDALSLEDAPRRLILLESLGGWHSLLANSPQAVAYFERAIALPAAPGRAPAPYDRVRLHCSAAITLITAGDTQAAELHLQQALSEVDQQVDAPEVADLLYTLAQLHWHKGEYREAFDTAQRSLAVAERLEKPEIIARAFEMLALACHSLGEWQQGMEFEHQRARLAGPALDVTDAFDVHL